MDESVPARPCARRALEWIDRHPFWCLALLAAVVALWCYRVETKREVPTKDGGREWMARWSFQDFCDVVYYPSHAFLHGLNPYDASRYSEVYHVQGDFPLYSPLTLLVHAPFALFRPHVGECVWTSQMTGEKKIGRKLLCPPAAERLYFGTCVVLVVILAHLLLRCSGLKISLGRVLALAALIHLSRPGYTNLHNGQVAAQMAIGVLMALHFARERPWVSGLGVALVSLKATYALPLVVFLLCRRQWRPVLIGLGIGGAGAAVAVAWMLVSGVGLDQLLESFKGSYAAFFTNPSVDVKQWPQRLDLLAVWGALAGQGEESGLLGTLVPVACLTVCGAAVWRSSRRWQPGRADDLSAAVAVLGLLVSVYHQAYDGLVLAIPLMAIALARHEAWRSLRAPLRWGLILLLSFPCLNYATTQEVLRRLCIKSGEPTWRVLASVNGTALLAALAVCLYLTFRSSRPRGEALTR